jgi:predicted regulator of Ras-like GTPase activity (Roadblock/LC7/MglB family)
LFPKFKLPMSSSTLSVPAQIKFDEAISLTQAFLSQLKNNELTASQIQDFVTDLVQTSNGARGFFVVYLTAQDPICDQPRSEIIAALQSNLEITADLLVKNIAMSTAQQVYHHRRNDPEMVASSATVTARTTKIIQQLNLPQMQDLCRELVNTINTGTGSYSEFLTQWGYDQEQKNSIAQAVTQLYA